MARKEKLDLAISKEIDALLERSADLFQKNDIPGSLRFALEAWELIPEPKERWDYYPQSLSMGFVQDYVDLRDKQNAQKWIEIAARMYDDPNHEDHYVLMVEGEAMFRLGDLERAYYVFDRIHELYGRKGFAGEQRAYLDFYLKKRAER